MKCYNCEEYDNCKLAWKDEKDLAFCTDYKQKHTNEKWFNGLSTIEKAMVIVLCCPYEADWFGENFEKRMEQRMKNFSQSAYGYEKGVNKIKDWLKAVHKDD